MPNIVLKGYKKGINKYKIAKKGLKVYKLLTNTEVRIVL